MKQTITNINKHSINKGLEIEKKKILNQIPTKKLYASFNAYCKNVLENFRSYIITWFSGN